MTTPKDNLREEISKLPIIDPHDSTVGGVIGEENLDQIMQKFTQALEREKLNFIDSEPCCKHGMSTCPRKLALRQSERSEDGNK